MNDTDFSIYDIRFTIYELMGMRKEMPGVWNGFAHKFFLALFTLISLIFAIFRGFSRVFSGLVLARQIFLAGFAWIYPDKS